MKVLLALAFLLWLGADARYSPEQDVRYPREHVERRYSPEYSLRGSPFVRGKTHRYELTINMTAGVPGLTSQVAKSLIHMDVSIRRESEHDYVLKAEYVKVSESGNSVDSGDAHLPLRRIPELERDLAQPIRFTYEDGEVKAYTLGSSESLPSRSIKRSILRHLQMKLDLSARNPRRGDEHDEYYPISYSTTERDEAGPYEAIYTVNVSPYAEYPYEDRVYNITRVHNYEPYGYPAYYEHHNFAQQGCPEVYRAGDYPPYTRYGSGRPVGYEPHQTPLKASKIVYHNLRYVYGKYILENIQVEEKSIAAMYDQDLVVSIESQYELKEVSDRRIDEPREQQSRYTELHTAPTEEELRREQPGSSEDVTHEYSFVYGIFDQVRSTELVAVADRILDKVSSSIVAAEIEGTRGQEVTEDVSHLQDVLSLLRTAYLDAVYRKIPDVRSLRRVPEEEKVKRQIFLDVLPLAGTDDSGEYIKYLIEERKLSVWEAKEVLEAIPANLIRATEKNIQDLLALTELPHVKQHHVLHSAAYLTVSNVIREAYVVPRLPNYYDEEDRSEYDSQREQGYRYHQENRKSKYYGPSYYEEDRNEGEYYPGSYRREHYRQRDEVPRYGEATLRRYIQEVRSKLRSASRLQEKVVYIEALAQLGHRRALKVLKPYVYGYAIDTEEYAPGDVDYLKTVVIYALHHIVEYYPEETQEIIAPVYFNHMEEPRVRIAAFSVLLRSQPSLAMLQHVAQDSYDEPSNEVGSYVYSALQTYGNALTPCMKPTADRIKLVISQFKNYDIGEQYSMSVIRTFFDELRNFGLEKRFAVVRSNESFFPSTLYTSLKYNIQSLRDIFYQAKLNVQGVTVEDLLKAIDYEVLGLKPPRDIPQGAESHIFKGLNLLPRLPKELRITFYKKIFYASSYHYIDAQSIGSYVLPLLDYLRDYFSMERGSVSGHFVKTYIPSSYHALTYSSIGFPVDFRMKHPLVLSLRVESRRIHRASSSAYAYYVRPSVYYGTYYKHSILNTAAEHAYGVYHEQKFTATFPVELSVYYDDDANTVEFSYRLPQVPKRVYRYQSETGTYENELTLRYAMSAEENREPIRTIPALFQHEQVVSGFGFPSLYVTYFTEDIQHEYTEVPQDLDDIVEFIVKAFHNPGYRRRDLNATIVTRPSSPVDQIKFIFSYNRTYYAPSESESSSSEQDSEEDDVQDYSRFRHVKYESAHRGRRYEDEYSVLSRIFPHRQVSPGEYEEISPEQAHRVHEAFSESLSKVAHELYLRVETYPSVNFAELEVEYNHTFDKTLHNLRAEVGAYSHEERTPYKMYLAHVMRYAHSPNEFRYEPRAYMGQYASFFHAITFGEHPRSYDQSDVIARGAFVKVPAEQHFSRDEFAERPDRDAFTPDTQEECERDVRDGKSQSPACIAAVEEDARLNKVYVRVTARQELPPAVQNFTYKLEDAVKYYYYDRAEINKVHVNNPPRTFDMIINYIDKLTDQPVLDVYIRKPTENVIYHKVDFEYLEPLSSVYTLHESYILKSTNYTYPPSCGLMEKHVRTYDMEVYPLPRDGCTYVMSTHCTERKKFTVLAKHVSPSDDYKEVYVYVADQKVVLKPERSSVGAYNIIYNDRPVEVRTPLLLDEENLLYVYPVSVYDEKVKYVLVLRAEKAGIKVEYDGKNVKLQVSPVYKGELCGLCSEYDGEISREYRGPNQCLYLDSEDFAHSSVIDAETCGVRTEPRYPAMCPNGERRVHSPHGPYPPYAPYSYNPYERSRYPHDEENDSEERTREEDDSEENSLYPFPDEEDYEGKSRYPYDKRYESYRRSYRPYYKEEENSSGKYRYRYNYDEDYEGKSRYPYNYEEDYEGKSRYPYNYDEAHEGKSRYPYSYEEDYEGKYRYPYDERKESYRRSRYPYDKEEDSSEKFRYPYNYEEDYEGKSRYPYNYEEDYEGKSRYPYDEQKESYRRYRYPYDKEDSSEKSRYPYTYEEEYERKSRYPYDEQNESYRRSRSSYDKEEESEKSRYPYTYEKDYEGKYRYPYYEQAESYRQSRRPYDQVNSSDEPQYQYNDEDESYKKSRYSYDDKDDSYRRYRYPYGDRSEYTKKTGYYYDENDKSYRRYRYPYDDQDESSVKSRYPYGDKNESYRKSRYPYDDQEESYRKSRHPYDEQEESYTKYRYPHEEQEESHKKYRYPYYDQEDSYRSSRYPYSEEDEFSKKSGYPYGGKDEYSRKYRYPYGDKDEYSRKYRYPYGDEDEYYSKNRYPYADQDDRESRYPYANRDYSSESRYPDDDQDEYSRKSRQPSDEKYQSYRKSRYQYYDDDSYRSRYPYGYQEKSYGESRYPYGYEDRSYGESRYPYGYEDRSYGESRYPYGYEDRSYGESRYPYRYEDRSYGESRYPYGYEHKSYRDSRYPYGYQDKSYGESRYPYGSQEKSYNESRYPYGDQDKSYSESRYTYGNQDKSYPESRYPYGYHDKSYSESRYPSGDEEKSHTESKYPYGDQDKSYRESRYGYQPKSYSEARYPYSYQDKSYSESKYPYTDDQSYGESYYPKPNYDDSYKRRSGYPTTSEEESYKKSDYPHAGKDEEQTTSYERGSIVVKIQPKERTLYKEKGEKICFSTQPIPVCGEGYKATEEYEKSVDYHCLPKNDVSTKRLVDESKKRVLRELSSKKVDFTESYSAAKYCALY